MFEAREAGGALGFGAGLELRGAEAVNCEQGAVVLIQVRKPAGDQGGGEGPAEQPRHELKVEFLGDEGEEDVANVELGENATKAPNVGGVGPAGLEDGFGRAVLRGADHRVVLIRGPDGGAEVDEADAEGAVRPAGGWP